MVLEHLVSLKLQRGRMSGKTLRIGLDSMFVNSAVDTKGKEVSRQKWFCLRLDWTVVNLVETCYLERFRANPFCRQMTMWTSTKTRLEMHFQKLVCHENYDRISLGTTSSFLFDHEMVSKAMDKGYTWLYMKSISSVNYSSISTIHPGKIFPLFVTTYRWHLTQYISCFLISSLIDLIHSILFT